MLSRLLRLYRAFGSVKSSLASPSDHSKHRRGCFFDPGAASLHARSTVRIIVVDLGTLRHVFPSPLGGSHRRWQERGSRVALHAFAVLFNEPSGSGISGYFIPSPPPRGERQ